MSEETRPLTHNIDRSRGPLDLRGYERAGGYQGLRRALQLGPKGVAEEVKNARLRGRGGAGFPTAQKWSFMPDPEKAPGPRYLVCNADEMEPGTFKDRLLLEGDPHQLVEGMAVAACALQVPVAYIFLRWAYAPAEEALRRAIAEAHEGGYLGPNVLGSGFSLELHLHTSAGRYICGEESALLNALEGKRPVPRAKPPFPQTSGLWGRPTVVQNAETLCNLPHILTRGAAWYTGLGKGRDAGTKIYGVSGRVQRPGAWELPMGTPLGEVLEHAGGMHPGLTFRGALPGGGSTSFVTEQHLGVAMDFESLQEAGSRLGTGTMIVLDDQTCPVGMVRNLEHFFAQESCGWCTPCREGLPWTEKALVALESGRGTPQDLETLEWHTRLIDMGATFCAHAPGAMAPLASAMRLFGEDFQRHVREQRCPWS